MWYFLIPQIPPEVMETLQKNGLLASRIKTFRELSIDFLATESNVFEFGLHDTLLKLHGSLPDPDYPALLGKKLATVCITLNEYPCIRFQSSSPYCREIATTLNYLLLQFKRYEECSFFRFLFFLFFCLLFWVDAFTSIHILSLLKFKTFLEFKNEHNCGKWILWFLEYV